MNESWEDLLCRVFDDGFEAVCLDLIDPMDSQALQQGIRRAGEMEQRIRELEAALSAIVEYDEKGYGEEYIRAIDDAKELLERKHA